MDNKETSSKYCYVEQLAVPMNMITDMKDQLKDGNIMSFSRNEWYSRKGVKYVSGFCCYLWDDGTTSKDEDEREDWSKFIIKVTNNERRKILTIT